MQISAVWKVGNAGVVVQTTSNEAAEILRKAAPPSLRVQEPKKRRPLVALQGLQGDSPQEEVQKSLYDQNLRKNPKWTLETLKAHCKIAFKKDCSVGKTMQP